MKKSLLAVAAIGAFASAAQAQSSVTVYGLLDVGYVGASSRVSNSGTATNGGQTKTTYNGFGGVGAENTSRLGFKGTEDLGGGTSAFFTAEFALFPQDQDLSGNATGGLSNRQTFVGLKKNGIGQGALGLQYTPVFNANAATNPNQSNNMIGDLVYAGTSVATTKGLESASAGSQSAGFTNRTANTLTLASDKFAGFGANLMYTLNNTNASSVAATNGNITTGGNTNASGWGIGADYTIQKFYVTAAYQSLKQLTASSNWGTPTAGAAGTSNPWSGAQPSACTGTFSAGKCMVAADASGSGLNVQDNQFLAGATYDFGILKAYAQYVSRKATSTQSSNYYVKRSAEQIGVRSYITPTIEAWASGSLGRYTAYGQNSPTANMNAWQLGSNYYLSKRTNLYAIYGQQLVSNSTTSAGNTISAGASNYAVGVRHTF